MALKTLTMNSGGSVPPEGWHEVTINKAGYGTLNNGTKFIDVWFNGFPESMNARVYEANNKSTGEEFAIANLFKHANAGIVDVLKDPTGKRPVIQYDDDAKHLAGKSIHVYVYKDGQYSRVLREMVPVVTTNGEKITVHESDVAYWKNHALKYYNDYVANKTDSTNGFSSEPDHDVEATADQIKEMVGSPAASADTDDLPF